MPAPTRSKLALSPVEYDWMVRTIRRKAEFADKMNLQRKTKEMIHGFAAKLDSPPEEVLQNGDYVVSTTRVEIRFLEEIARNDAKTLRTIVLPNYESKHNKAGAARSLEQAKLLEGIVNRISKVLGGA